LDQQHAAIMNNPSLSQTQKDQKIDEVLADTAAREKKIDASLNTVKKSLANNVLFSPDAVPATPGPTTPPPGNP
jgi:hypothetical protein